MVQIAVKIADIGDLVFVDQLYFKLLVVRLLVEICHNSGRSIIAGSGKEVILTFNGGSGSQQEYDHLAAVQTDGTEESTHRISNEKLDDSPEKANAKDKEPIKNSALCISSNAKNVHDRR